MSGVVEYKLKLWQKNTQLDLSNNIQTAINTKRVNDFNAGEVTKVQRPKTKSDGGNNAKDEGVQ